jgi:HD-GYP domain-containing protein (c-di-GMP phosphodiesterase class II)
MQTELKTVKDEKLVDLDVSGEGAEIELEDKSHGAVKPDKYEEIKTEEKDPLKPDVEVQEQSEEMDQYSDKVKKRIDKLTFKVREAEREREAALQFAQNVQKELAEAKTKAFDIDKGYMSESEVRNKMASDLARQNLISAREAGDYTKEEEARQALTKLDLEAERIRVTKSKKEQEYEAYQKELEQQPTALQQQAVRTQPSQKAIDWAEKNTWFKTDQEMTDYAQRIHRGLVAEGFDTESDNYYNELTQRVKLKFPESFEGSDQTTRSAKIAQPVASANRSATTGRKSVRLSPSQVKIANKLGVPLSEYAKYV